MSIKLSRKPRLHSRFPLRQFKQSGVLSSHLRCRSRHVRQPVRTRLGFIGIWTIVEEMGSSFDPLAFVNGIDVDSIFTEAGLKEVHALGSSM